MPAGPAPSITPLRELDLAGRRVLVRADLDGPRSPYGAVLDDSPLRALLPTLRVLLEARARILVAARLTTTPDEMGIPGTVAQSLGELLGTKVGVLDKNFAPQVQFLAERQVALTPNLASIPEDAANNPYWAAAVARSVDVYVLDGIRAASESSASVVSVPRLMPERGAGLQVTAALEVMRSATVAPIKPYTLVLGGASIARVLPVATALLPLVTDVVVGGSVGNTFLAAQGWRPGGSPYEPNAVAAAEAFLVAAANARVKIHTPLDVVVRITRPGSHGTYEVRKVNRPFTPEEAAVDIAIETGVAYADVLSQSASSLWIGLMGDCSVEETQSDPCASGRRPGASGAPPSGATTQSRRAASSGSRTVFRHCRAGTPRYRC